jgi:hypothetical protein
MRTAEELPFTDEMSTWLAATAGRERTVSRVVLVVGALVFLFGGFVGLIVAGVAWLFTRDATTLATTLVIEAVVIVVCIFVWRRLRARQTDLSMDLRERVFLRTTGDLTLQRGLGGVDDPDVYELEVPGRTLTLNSWTGARLQDTFRHRPDVSTMERGSGTAFTLPAATADYTRYAGVLLTLRDSAGELVYTTSP